MNEELKKRVEQITELAHWLEEHQEAVREAGLSILLGMSDDEKIITLGATGFVLPTLMMAEILVRQAGEHIGVDLDEECEDEYEEFVRNLN